MRIIHILNEIKASGAEAMLVSAKKYWDNEGYILSALATGAKQGDYAVELENVGYKISHIAKSSLLFLPSFHFIIQLFSFFKKERFEIVHIHPESFNFSYAVIARIALPKCKIIRTVHHIFPQPKTIKGQVIRSIRILQRFIMRHVLGVKFISNSDSGLKNESNTYYSSNFLAYNWFDSIKFKCRSEYEYLQARESLGIPNSVKLIVSLGGNWAYKNYDKIIQAIDKLPKEVQVLYYQVGPDEGNKLAKLADNIGDERIKICGRVDDPVEYLTAADCYIMPSELEGFGVAAAEAMGRGLPAILSNRPALKDYKKVIEGIFWTEPSVDSIKHSLLELSKYDNSYLFDIGQGISVLAHKNYSSQVGAAAYAGIYSK